MTIAIDLCGIEAVPAGRHARILSELTAVSAAVGSELEVVAAGEAAFAARLAVVPGVRVGRSPGTPPSLVYRPSGEAGVVDHDAPMVLLEPLDLAWIVEGVAGAARRDAQSAGRLRALAADHRVHWRTASAWQDEVLVGHLGVAPGRIARLPAAALTPAVTQLAAARLPPPLPGEYFLSLTPLGANGDLLTLVSAHGALGQAAPPLVLLGVEDEAWRPALAAAVESAGTRGRVLVLRDLDPVSEAAAIRRASAVVAADRHPAHAVRLRQAAAAGRPAAVREHSGHRAWVDGGSWFGDDRDGLVAALRAPAAVRLRDAAGTADSDGGLVSWLVDAARRQNPREVSAWER